VNTSGEKFCCCLNKGKNNNEIKIKLFGPKCPPGASVAMLALTQLSNTRKVVQELREKNSSTPPLSVCG
jgi:hypothetical protein